MGRWYGRRKRCALPLKPIEFNKVNFVLHRCTLSVCHARGELSSIVNVLRQPCNVLIFEKFIYSFLRCYGAFDRSPIQYWV